MAKKKDGLLPVIIAMAVLLVVSIGFLAGYNAWVNRELSAEEDANLIAGKYDGGTITKGEVMDRFNDVALMYYQQYGTVSGYESQILNQAAYNVITDKLLPLKAAELGLADLTDEEKATLETTAQERYESSVTSYIDGYLTEEEKALSEDEQRQAAVSYLTAEGISVEFFYDQELLSLYSERLKEIAIADVVVTDEDVHAKYEEQVAADQTTYAEPWYYSLMEQYGVTSLWAPEGVRLVKHILLIPDEEYTQAYGTTAAALASALSSIDAAEAKIAELEAAISGEPAPTADAAEATQAPTATADPEATPEPPLDEQLTAKQAELAELNASLPELRAAVETARANAIASKQEVIDSINARLEAGEDFEALIAEFGEDPGMQTEPGLSTGYYVADGSINWLAEFSDTAMELEKVGDVSEPTVSQSGIHIIRYMSDVKPGATSEADAHDYLANLLKETKDSEAYQAALDQWIKDYNFVIYSDVLGLS